MKRTVLISIILLFFGSKMLSQSIYTLIADNDYDKVNEYKGPLNIYNSQHTTPVMWAIYKSDLKMVKLLVSKGADPAMKSWMRLDSYLPGSNLVLAAWLGKTDIIDYLVDNGYFDINEPEYKFYNKDLKCAWNALQTVAYSNNVEIVRYLVEKGANINALSETDANRTALLMAIDRGNINTAMELVKLGADVNIRDVYYNSSLEMAINRGEKELVKAIYNKGFKFTENRKDELQARLKETFKVGSFEEL